MSPPARSTRRKPNAQLVWRIVAIGLLGAAGVLSWYFGFHVKRPALKIVTETFVIFAGLYVAAQATERLIELFVAPWVPGNTPQERANKAIFTGAVATVAGVILSGTIGLYLIHAISQQRFGSGGDDVARTFDILVTGLAIGGGTKPLHDLIKRIEKAKEKAEEDTP